MVRFFLEDRKYVIELTNIFNLFSKFSGLKPNKSKCEIADIGALKGVQVALCSMRCIYLVSNIVKILGIYYYYNKKLEIQENFKRHIIKTKKTLQIWGIKDLSIAGNCENNSKFNYTRIIQCKKIFKKFMWKTRNSKIKHDTLCKN